MALTPEEALKFTEEEEKLIKELEIDIDKRIKETFPDYAGKAIYGLQRNISLRFLKEIKRRYEEAGWIIEYYPDCRGGDWFEFRPVRNSNLERSLK